MEHHPAALPSGLPLTRPEGQESQSTGTTIADRPVQLLADCDQVSQTKPEVKDRVIRMGLLENDSFPYLAWSPEEGKHKKEAQEPMSIEDTLQVVKQLRQLIIHPNVIGRFHACAS